MFETTFFRAKSPGDYHVESRTHHRIPRNHLLARQVRVLGLAPLPRDHGHLGRRRLADRPELGDHQRRYRDLVDGQLAECRALDHDPSVTRIRSGHHLDAGSQSSEVCPSGVLRFGNCQLSAHGIHRTGNCARLGLDDRDHEGLGTVADQGPR